MSAPLIDGRGFLKWDQLPILDGPAGDVSIAIDGYVMTMNPFGEGWSGVYPDRGVIVPMRGDETRHRGKNRSPANRKPMAMRRASSPPSAQCNGGATNAFRPPVAWPVSTPVGMGRRPRPRHEMQNCPRPVARYRSAIFEASESHPATPPRRRRRAALHREPNGIDEIDRGCL